MADCPNLTLDAVDLLNGTAREESTAAAISRVINSVVLPSVCAFGVVGNLLNLTILTRRKLQKSFRSLEQAANLCLIALAVSDLMFCLMVIPSTFLPKDMRHSSENSLLAVYNLYMTFVINIFIMESTLLTVAMSLERFMAICFPLRQDLYLTTRRIKYIIAFTVLFSVSFNIPVIFRYQMRSHCRIPETGNWTLSTTEVPAASQPLDSMELTFLGERQDYSVFNSSIVGCVQGFQCATSNGSILEKNVSVNRSNILISPEPFNSARPQSDSRSYVLPELFLPAVSTPGTMAASDGKQPLPHVAFPDNNSTSSTATTPSVRPVYYTVEEIEIGNSTALNATYRWLWAVAGNFVPLSLLFYFNVCLWWRIYLSYKLRRQFHQAPRSSHILTLTLIAIVVMFFILVAPSETVLALKDNITMEKDTATAIEHILNLMQAVNFSVNFILYCIISPYFRKTLKYIVLCGLYNVYPNSSTRESKKDCETSLV